MHFTRIRISGFKSFVDPVELLIEPGTTGVVGPNGCGKSNIVEALRWVMGETSAKSLRGGEMDDVIFGGTTSRPARNIAEVVIHIDNSDRKAPAMFNDSEELEVSRRIERDAGSVYRVNGREVRARDVQLLFADLATGAHSTAMVSQGRITAMIGAKPVERRALLEEAAGIQGLHSRRHEAELRLRAAETNLERLDDVVGALEGQLQGLQRQARQAKRYRRLSEQIRRFDAILLHHAWTAASNSAGGTREHLDTARDSVAEQATRAAAAATAQAQAAAALPPARRREAEDAAALQHLRLAGLELDAEAERVATARAEIAGRLEQIAGDIDREATLEADAAAAAERLETERKSLADAQAAEESDRNSAAAALAEAESEVEAKESALHELTRRLADTQARRDALASRIGELGQRIERLGRREEELAAERGKHQAESGEESALSDAASAIGEAEAAAKHSRKALEAADTARAGADEEESHARAALREADSARAGLAAEAHALSRLLEPMEGDGFPPLIDAVSVDAGYEAALGAALGEDLNAPANKAAAIYWSTLPPLEAPPLPGGAPSLADFVKAPPVLARRLAAIGVAADSAAGAKLAGDLLQGQRLVSRDGALWRWDGYTIAAGAPTAAATRLAQRNRLEELHAELATADKKTEATRNAADAAQEAREQAIQAERAAREATHADFEALNAARESHATLVQARAATQSQLAALAEAAEGVASDRAETQTQLNTAEQSLAGLDDPAAAREAVATARTALAELRARYTELRGAHDRLAAEAERRGERLLAIEAENASWRRRTEGARGRLQDLARRQSTAGAERDRLAVRPEEIEEQKVKLMDRVAGAEARRNKAADALATAEAAQGEADRALKSAETTLAEAREAQIRAEAGLEQAEHELAAVAARIREKLDVAPDKVLDAAGIDAGESLSEADSATARLERLTRERDNMGPVNLRAEVEAAELEEQIATMRAERDDLLAAIARLRQGIGSLNREGRERLMSAFGQVNEHFQELFTRLFGGGRAHLALSEADDPLDAGLEIMASPPGKKLTSMSLLSGGEQALTAVALLFAVFLTNPAPICVLDEVDAPLDDSNVDRFCALVGDIARGSDTRFLLVTHHRMTMARMDRLFGVTMGEAGVSQLVSVDLSGAEAIRETA